MRTKEKSIVNFAYFTANFPPKFIESCWIGNQLLIDHLNGKLRSSDGQYISVADFMKFFFELSRDHQIKLVNWIENNYNGVR